jgi:Fe-S-cluster-containing dehydrogenase component
MKDTSDFDSFWESSVQIGRIPNTEFPTRSVTLKADWAREAPTTSEKSTGLDIQFRPDPVLHDGRFANNGWLQELPKPITKLTWGNAAIMGPETATRLGIDMYTEGSGGQHGRLRTKEVELRYQGRSVRAAAFVLPGHAEGAVTVHLGHGRTRAGRVGSGIGFNAYRLRTADALGFGSGLEVIDTGDRTTLACTQAHHSMEGRDPVKRGTAAQFRHDPKSLTPSRDLEIEKAAVTAIHTPGTPLPLPQDRDSRLTPPTLYPEWPYEGRRWAMTIDLSTCTGCSACVVACQSENNIPIVGEKQVIAGREMHWLRIDEYQDGVNRFAQPVPCMHCEKAPCEVVCPVGATVHSADGLNDMVYNRCVGTRYCSNNCPYKVRRFNFLDYSDFAEEALKPLHNPEVTVRSRGVMEKCTYCVQRIRGGERDTELAGEPLRDGRIKTACQQACPSQAIQFGDWNDPTSEVREWKNQPHNYALLAELNTLPRTTYLAAVRNPNPAMPEGA